MLAKSQIKLTKKDYGEYFGPCDIGFLGATGTGVADVSVSFEILLEVV